MTGISKKYNMCSKKEEIITMDKRIRFVKKQKIELVNELRIIVNGKERLLDRTVTDCSGRLDGIGINDNVSIDWRKYEFSVPVRAFYFMIESLVKEKDET